MCPISPRIHGALITRTAHVRATRRVRPAHRVTGTASSNPFPAAAGPFRTLSRGITAAGPGNRIPRPTPRETGSAPALSAIGGPRSGDPGTEVSNPASSSGESTPNPVGLAQVEWPVRRRRSSWQAQRCGNPWHNKTVGPLPQTGVIGFKSTGSATRHTSTQDRRSRVCRRTARGAAPSCALDRLRETSRSSALGPA